jgi:hypothetical protein
VFTVTVTYTENGVTRWKTKYMTWREGRNLLNELQTLGKGYQKQDCWGLIERGSFGYDLEEDKDPRIVDIDKEEAAARSQRFLDGYVRSVTALAA